MPIYQYQGAHYDLPDGLSNEEAIAKIKTHLGQSTTPEPQPTKDQPEPTVFNSSLPAGLLETATTGAAQAVGGTLAKGIGGIVGSVMPGQTAAGTADKYGQAFGKATDSFLSPETESGKAIANKITGAMEGFQHYYQDPTNVQNTLGAIPFMPQSVANSPQVGGIASGLAQSLPDLSVLSPLLGHKGTPEVAPKAPAPTGNPILDALSKIDSSAKPTDIAPTNPLVDTRDGLAKSKLAYEQALHEQELARQSAFNRPEQIGNLPQEDPMSRMARDLGAEPNKVETPVDTTTPMGNVADQLTKDVGNGKTMSAQDMIDARNAEHDKIAENLVANHSEYYKPFEKTASNTEQSVSMQEHADQIAAEIKAHQDHIAAEEQHRAHIEETHAHALDEQARLEAAQKAVEERQRSIEKAISSHPDAIDSAFKVAAERRKADVAKMQGENDHPVNDYMAFEAELRKQMNEAPTKSRKQLAIEAKAKAQAERERIIHQRAENEQMIQKLRDQHTESEIRTKRAQADAQESINKRNTDHVSDLMVPAVQRAVEAKKKADWIANLRAEADRQEALKAAQDKVLQANAKKRAIQEITHSAGSKERAAAVKAINSKFGKKSKQGGGVFFGENGIPDYKSMWEDVSKRSDPKEIIKRNEAEIAAELKKTTGINYTRLEDLMHQNDNLKAIADLNAGQKFTKDLQTGGPVKKSVSEPVTNNLAGDDVNTSKSKEAGLFGADKDGITELHSGIPLPKEVRDRLDNGMKYLADLADRRFGEPLTQAKNYVANSFKEARDVIGAVGNVTAPKDIIARATAPGATDIPLNPEATMKLPFNRRFNYGALSESVQSGLNMAALKFKENPVLRGVQEYLNTGLARTNYQISKIVVPLNKMINRLSPADIVTHDGILQREQKRGQAFTDDQLRAAGLSDKNLAAYKMQREAYDSAYKLQNEQLKRMGEKELSREDYYYSSRWTGDYHAPIFKDRIGVDGKPIIDPATNKPKQDLVWHIRTETRADGERALAYLKENYPELNIHKDGVQTKMMFIGDNRNPNAPRDIANTYRDMMGYLKDNPEATESISKIMESYLEGQGYKSVGQSKHFMVKTGIRGFAGDTPWLTPEESALKGTKSQIDYLKNAIRWANLQETVANAKEVLSHPDVIKNQPNAVALAQTILNRELGKDTNIVAPIENLVAKTFGVSRNSVLRLVGDVKGMTYLQTLGLNPMYSLATAFQFMFTGPMMHIVMSSEGGYKTGIAGAAKTLALGMSDATAGILAHMSHEMGSNTVEGFISKAGMTDIGKEALKFMENSGYIKRNIFDESRHVGQHGFMDKVQAGLGWTIGKPEQVARMMAFMSFVHHLDASGAFHGDHMAIFHEAEIYSDRALSSFKSFDRPLMVDKLGAIGQAGYVYQSFKFQSFHTTNAAVRLAARGNWKPLMALMVGYGLGTGLMNMPGMQELDGAVEGVKDLIAKMKPNWYTPEIRDFDLRDQMINHLPTTKIFRQMSARSLATNGLAGEATGLNMAPHVSPQVLDTEHLGNNFPGAVMAQEAKEWGSVGKMLIYPNSSTLTEAAYKNLPGAKGPMEEFLPNIKQGNTPGHQVFINPNDMNSPKTMPYTRNQDDEAARKINAVSAREGNLKQNWYRSNMEDARIKEALSGNINGFLGAYHRNNVGDMADYIKAYVNLDPESTRIDEAVNNGIPAQYMSQEDRRVANAKKLLVLQAIQRNRSMPK